MRQNDDSDDWFEVEFWGGSKDGEYGLFRRDEWETGELMKHELVVHNIVVGQEVWKLGAPIFVPKRDTHVRLARYLRLEKP